MSGPPNLNQLRTYAHMSPDALPNAVLLHSTDDTLTVFDVYPKARFHFLLLPRIRQPESDVATLDTLQSLLKSNKSYAHKVLLAMARDAEEVKKLVQEEMSDRYKHKWDIYMGFHAQPSMHHLHLHIISGDLESPSMKKKKHYNSFHPKLGFFIHLEDVLSWFEAEPHFFAEKVKSLQRHKFASILKEDLFCLHCGAEMKNIPTLKAHLEEEITKLDQRAEKREAFMRRLEKSKARSRASDSHKRVADTDASTSDEAQPQHKRIRSGEVENPIVVE